MPPHTRVVHRFHLGRSVGALALAGAMIGGCGAGIPREREPHASLDVRVSWGAGLDENTTQRVLVDGRDARYAAAGLDRWSTRVTPGTHRVDFVTSVGADRLVIVPSYGRSRHERRDHTSYVTLATQRIETGGCHRSLSLRARVGERIDVVYHYEDSHVCTVTCMRTARSGRTRSC